MGWSDTISQEDIASLYKLVADAFDDLIGVRNNPERLLTVANVIFVTLFLSSLLILAKLPDDHATTVFDQTPKVDQHYRISITPSALIHNATLLAQSRKTVKMLFTGFIVLVLILIFLVNL